MNEQQQITVNIDLQPVITCPKCQSVHFIEIKELRYLAPFIAGNAKATAIVHPKRMRLQCLTCKTIYDSPADLIDNRNTFVPLTIAAEG